MVLFVMIDFATFGDDVADDSGCVMHEQKLVVFDALAVSKRKRMIPLTSRLELAVEIADVERATAFDERAWQSADAVFAAVDSSPIVAKRSTAVAL